ncbi:hypothetical protein AX15_003321 [Amanita polypyramis BW_CC]|nr:hypothetical protein AX15_003321 [Amanita polypyramis BW_CC]
MTGFDTVQPADSLEFCPHPQASGVFVCGTYKLNERSGAGDATTPLRQGQCLVFHFDGSSKSDGLGFRQTQAIEFPAIPDMKWCHTIPPTNPILGVADSEANITVLQWRIHEFTLEKLYSVTCASQETLCLSLDWCNRKTRAAGLGDLVVSLSNGSLCLLRPLDDGKLYKTNEWFAHEYESWIAAWDYWDTNIIYSGGDDSTLNFWDIRQNFTRPFFTNRRFDAGVTAIQSHPFIENLIAVGSYNNNVSLFDRRKASVSLSEVDVKGGVWRVKWNPHENRKRDLLVASMRDGFKVLHYENGMHQGQVLQRFDDHESLAYGVDWSFEPPSEDGKQVVGSCSFYDHLLHIWRA